MDLVITLGTGLSFALWEEKGGRYYLDQWEKLNCNLAEEQLLDASRLETLLMAIYAKYPYLSEHSLTVALAYGSGLEYRTLSIPKDILYDYDQDATAEEIEDYLLEVFRNYQPSGLEQLYGSYLPCLMAVHPVGQEAVLSLAFMPKQVIDNLRAFTQKHELKLRAISPLAYGLYNALEVPEEGFYLDAQASYLYCNNNLLQVWPKPASLKSEDAVIGEYFARQAARLLGAEAESKQPLKLKPESTDNYVDSLKLDVPLPLSILGGAGCLLPQKQINPKNEEKGGGNSVTHSLRKLFKKE